MSQLKDWLADENVEQTLFALLAEYQYVLLLDEYLQNTVPVCATMKTEMLRVIDKYFDFWLELVKQLRTDNEQIGAIQVPAMEEQPSTSPFDMKCVVGLGKCSFNSSYKNNLARPTEAKFSLC